MPGVPGIFAQEQALGWKKVVDAVHEKGGFIYCQLWHAGRATIPHMTGSPTVCPSTSVWDDPTECYAYPPVGSSERVRYADYPPITLSIPHINKTIQDYCNAAQRAMEAGFDGVELHAGNGYLPEQFLSSNVNKRTDDYGGTPEKRCKFVLELMDELAKVVGEENLSIRLSPFGLFNQNRSQQRIETWYFLCQRLKEAHPKLSYVSFIEPVSESDTFAAILSSFFPIRYNPLVTRSDALSTPSSALRADFQYYRKRRLPQILGSRRRRPIYFPGSVRLDTLLLRRRLERHKSVGCDRVRQIRRLAVRPLLYQQSRSSGEVENGARTHSIQPIKVLRALRG